MNKSNVLALAEFLEAEAASPTFDVGFNMGDYVARIRRGESPLVDQTGHGCGTTACLAGWEAIRVEGRDSVVNGMSGKYVHTIAAESLGLREADADALFLSFPDSTLPEKVRPDVAIGCLRLLAETGEVDWNEAQARADAARSA